MGFTRLNGEAFEAQCNARIVEPTSRLDSLRILADLGLGTIDQNKLYRSLAKATEQAFALNHNYQSFWNSQQPEQSNYCNGISGGD